MRSTGSVTRALGGGGILSGLESNVPFPCATRSTGRFVRTVGITSPRAAFSFTVAMSSGTVKDVTTFHRDGVRSGATRMNCCVTRPC